MPAPAVYTQRAFPHPDATRDMVMCHCGAYPVRRVPSVTHTAGRYRWQWACGDCALALTQAYVSALGAGLSVRIERAS